MLNELPVEILFHLFSYLTPETAVRISLTNLNFAQINEAQFFWRAKFKRHFPSAFGALEKKTNFDFYAAFREQYEIEYRNVDKDESRNQNKIIYKKLSPRERRLFSAVKESDLKALDGVLQLADLDLRDVNNTSLLRWALKIKNQAVLDYIYSVAVKNYASGDHIDTSQRDKLNRTIFYWAIICHQSVEQLNLLLLQGSTLEEEYFGIKYRPIHIAAQAGRLDLVQALIEADHGLLGQSDVYGQTPLLWAAAEGHADVANYLIGKSAIGMDDATNCPGGVDHGKTPLYWAVQNGHAEVVKLLVKANASLRVVAGVKRYQPIHIAAQAGHLDIVQTLLEADPGLLEQKDALEQTPLLWAAANGHIGVVEYLLGKDANVAAVTNFPGHDEGHQKSTLHWAVQNGHAEVMKLLVKANASLRVVAGVNRYQPIHLAAQAGRLDIVQTLLEADPALLDQKDALEQTPLLWAAAKGHVDVVQYLLGKGANVAALTNYPGHDEGHQKTVLHWAAQNGHAEVVKCLVAANANTRAVCDDMRFQPIHLAAQEGNLQVVQALIDADAGLLEQRDVYGQAPLHWAAAKGHVDVVRYLIGKGADVAVATIEPGSNNDGKTPLHCAAERGHNEIVRILSRCIKVPYLGEPINDSKLDQQTKNEIKLLEYISNRRDKADYLTSFSLFCFRIDFGYSCEEKIKAATALRDYVQETDVNLKEAKKQQLTLFKRVLNNGRLGEISRNILATPSL